MNERGAAHSAPGRDELWVVDWQSAMNYLRRQPYVIDRFGMTGYCFGGGVTWNVAIKDPSLRAAAPYYGRSAYIEESGERAGRGAGGLRGERHGRQLQHRHRSARA